MFKKRSRTIHQPAYCHNKPQRISSDIGREQLRDIIAAHREPHRTEKSYYHTQSNRSKAVMSALFVAFIEK